MVRFVVVAICFLFPIATHAAVVIHEVAWMGSDVSANDEWIELHNSGGSPVPLDGWVLSDGMNLNIPLAGSIAASQYAVLERTDDTSALGSAFLIYAGALTNSGATLTLYRSDGSMEDRVAGGENWENIGGDNVTKETAQYTTSGWVTALATPGKQNALYQEVSEEVTSESGGEGSAAQTIDKKVNKMPVSLVLPDVTLSLVIDAPDTVYVHQKISFSVEPSGLGKVIMDSLQYTWNFGDITTKSGKKSEHVFMYPGEYVMTVHAVYGRHEQIARKKITVLPVSFSITKNLAGDIQIHNNAKYEVDISGYKIVGGDEVIFPKHTILLPNATITIPKNKLGNIQGKQVQLLDDVRVLVAALSEVYLPNKVAAQETSVGAPQTLSALTEKDETPQRFAFQDETSELAVATSTDTKNTLPASAIASNERIPKEALPYIGLIMIITLGIFGVYATGIKKHN